MNLWAMIAIIVVAGSIAEVLKAYFKRKSSGEEVEKILKTQIAHYEDELQVIKKRIRNLEVIAATSPDEFQDTGIQDSDEFDFESEDEFNEKLVNQLARKKLRNR
jgi:hypothetical protein